MNKRRTTNHPQLLHYVLKYDGCVGGGGGGIALVKHPTIAPMNTHASHHNPDPNATTEEEDRNLIHPRGYTSHLVSYWTMHIYGGCMVVGSGTACTTSLQSHCQWTPPSGSSMNPRFTTDKQERNAVHSRGHTFLVVHNGLLHLILQTEYLDEITNQLANLSLILLTRSATCSYVEMLLNRNTQLTPYACYVIVAHLMYTFHASVGPTGACSRDLNNLRHPLVF